MLYLPKVVVLS